MDLLTPYTLRITGLSGILGAVLFIAGDLLYHHIRGSQEDVPVRMSRLPEARLLAAGMLGYVGCWLYCLAALHIYIALLPTGEAFALIFGLAFAATMVGYGVSHTAYFSIAAGAKAAARAGADPEAGGRLGMVFYQRMVTITYLPVVVAGVMMLYAVAAGTSLYPRWMVVFLPVVTYLLKAPLARVLRGPFGEKVRDAYDNVVLLVFYGLSTMVLWNSL